MSASSLMTGYRIETSLNNPAEAKRYADRLLDLFPDSAEAKEMRGVRRG